jgi:hypothetical protein
MPPVATVAAASSSEDHHPVAVGPELALRVAERFGLPVVILLLVMWWVRSDIVQPLLDAHFEFIRTVVSGQQEHTRHMAEFGRKLDELIEVSSQK